jgi:hypothetical protein
MRIRFSLGLSGPFTLTTGRPSGSGGVWAALILLGLLYLGAWFTWPGVMLILHTAAITVGALLWLGRRGRSIRHEAGRDGPALHQFACPDCGAYGGWTPDETKAEADRDAHRCPDMTKPPRPDQ